MNMGVVSTESRRWCWFPGAGVKGSCESSNVGSEFGSSGRVASTLLSHFLSNNLVSKAQTHISTILWLFCLCLKD